MKPHTGEKQKILLTQKYNNSDRVNKEISQHNFIDLNVLKHKNQKLKQMIQSNLNQQWN